MRIVFTVLLLTVAFLGSRAQESPLKSDGRMWETYGTSGRQATFIKAAYVQGAVEGLRTGVTIGYVNGRVAEKTGSSLTEVIADANKIAAKLAPQNASALDIVHQMDKFYSDNRNTPVCMIQALQESIQSLNGAASSESDLEAMRKLGCN